LFLFRNSSWKRADEVSSSRSAGKSCSL